MPAKPGTDGGEISDVGHRGWLRVMLDGKVDWAELDPEDADAEAPSKS